MNKVRCALTGRTDLPLTYEVVGMMKGLRRTRRVNYIGAAMAKAWIGAKEIDQLTLTPDSIRPFDNIFSIKGIANEDGE